MFGSTIATIAVFVPLAFIPGVVGQLFVPLAASVAFALLASTVVALTVVPALGAIFLGRTGKRGTLPTRTRSCSGSTSWRSGES